MERLIQTEEDRKLLERFIMHQKLPFRCSVREGGDRSIEQNRLQRMWCNEIAEQWEGHTPEYVRGYSKLCFGVPILRAAHEKYREVYDRLLKPKSMEEKIELMMEPIDLAVTRAMKVREMSLYLDHMHAHFSGVGYTMTIPEHPW